ncbi:uncharacterized protein LOC128388474 [Panonychus citri]|uniref:uncharacterized protein LOC128388474 n=1 Tax=Panonychus citri TaxID=50023 RepID=UPI0023079651|nr:uncharacterized protein LOC128388474 [Panonychus citri]
MLTYESIQGVIFCKNYINRGYCYGLGCKFLHVTRREESHYKRTGLLEVELAEQWKRIQEALNQRDPDICQDQNKSKCFRVHCKFGKHLKLRTDLDAGNVIEFTFRPSPIMLDYIGTCYGTPTPYWYSDVLCHLRTPFTLLAQHIINTLRPFRIKANQVSFHYNDREIPNDPSITPLSLDIGNNCDVYVDIRIEDNSLAEFDCPICLTKISDFCYTFPCDHLFDVNCALTWFCSDTRKGWPICRGDVDELHMRVDGNITRVD